MTVALECIVAREFGFLPFPLRRMRPAEVAGRDENVHHERGGRRSLAMLRDQQNGILNTAGPVT